MRQTLQSRNSQPQQCKPGKPLNQMSLSRACHAAKGLGQHLALFPAVSLQGTASLILLWTREESPTSLRLNFCELLVCWIATPGSQPRNQGGEPQQYIMRMLLSEEAGWQAETTTLHSVNVKSQAHKAACGGGQGSHYRQKNSMELSNPIRDLGSCTHPLPDTATYVTFFPRKSVCLPETGAIQLTKRSTPLQGMPGLMTRFSVFNASTSTARIPVTDWKISVFPGLVATEESMEMCPLETWKEWNNPVSKPM